MFSDQSLLIVVFCLLTLSQYNTNLVYVKRQRYKIAFFGGGGHFSVSLNIIVTWYIYDRAISRILFRGHLKK